MKNKIHSIILNSQDPVNDLDTYFTNKQSERDSKWAAGCIVFFIGWLIFTVIIFNR